MKWRYLKLIELLNEQIKWRKKFSQLLIIIRFIYWSTFLSIVYDEGYQTNGIGSNTEAVIDDCTALESTLNVDHGRCSPHALKMIAELTTN